MSQLSWWFTLGYRIRLAEPKKWGKLFASLLLLLGIVASPGAAQQPERVIRVAAAADLQPVLPVLADRYEKATGVKLLISYGSSGNLTTQILNGAPMDLFLGADFVFPEKVVAAGLADSTAPTQYARGTLVLWARKDSPLQPITIDSLVDKRVTAVAIANDLRAPYGQAAVAALRRLRMYDRVKPHLVVAENIAQAAQFVESGNAQLGLVSLTAASTQRLKTEGSFVRIPASAYAPIMQCAVVMKNSDRKAEAHAFLNWLLKPEIQSSLAAMGLQPVR
ncbi:MAG TPA: molybdate ABC transporter substrate-binding protein [Edaphobacter sp.]|nr:molybdate ABC transporter substrate-binding protein [Edaphobacter sp.]